MIRALVVAAFAAVLAGCEGMAGDMKDAGTPPVPEDSGVVPPPEDAGVLDAGSGTFDAGTLDAGVANGPPDAGVAVAAELTVLFPPPGCATSDTHLLVHGKTRAGLSVSSVNVAGEVATTTDNFQNWQADVQLTLGANSVAIDFTESGVTHTAFVTLQIQRFVDENSVMRGSGGWSGRVLGVAWDAQGQRYILADDIDDGVWGVAAGSGNRVELANSESNKIGGGVDITQPRSGVVRGTTSYVLDVVNTGGMDMPNITALNLSSGDRSIAASLPAVMNDLTLHPNGVEAVGASLDLKAVLAVNLDTGAVRVVSSSAVGSGIAAGNFGPLGLSAVRHTAYVGLRYQDTIVAVDLDTGDRSVFSNATGSEPHFSDPEYIAVDDNAGKAFVWDSKQLVAVDLTTGRRTVFGAGPFAWATAVNAMAATAYGITIVDYVPSWEPPPQRAPTLVVFDPLTGTRVVASR